MAKKLSKAAQLRAFITANPTLSSSVIADKFGVKAAYVSSTKWQLKKKGVEIPKAKKLLGVTIATDQIPTLTDEQITRLVDNSRKPKMRMLGAFTSNKPMIMEFTPPSDPVNHPAHYKAGGIETIDFIEAKKLGYNLGNVVKYITRADLKGNRKQDLEKAKWYLEREISTR